MVWSTDKVCVVRGRCSDGRTERRIRFTAYCPDVFRRRHPTERLGHCGYGGHEHHRSVLCNGRRESRTASAVEAVPRIVLINLPGSGSFTPSVRLFALVTLTSLRPLARATKGSYGATGVRETHQSRSGSVPKLENEERGTTQCVFTLSRVESREPTTLTACRRRVSASSARSFEQHRRARMISESSSVHFLENLPNRLTQTFVRERKSRPHERSVRIHCSFPTVQS